MGKMLARVKPHPALRTPTCVPRTVVFQVQGQEFEISRPFLAMHSPVWAKRLAEEPSVQRHQLTGASAESFGAFVRFLTGADGAEGRVTSDNVFHLLKWGKEFGVDYVISFCEEFLCAKVGKLGPGREGVANVDGQDVDAAHLLDLAARHDMPLLYARATEVVAHDMHSVVVPEDGVLPDIFASGAIRDDVVNAHITMGLMRNDGEGRRKHRFADLSTMPGLQRATVPERQRARLLWKARSRLVPPPEALPEANWKVSPATVWPHHSLRDESWTVVPHETQPQDCGRVARPKPGSNMASGCP